MKIVIEKLRPPEVNISFSPNGTAGGLGFEPQTGPTLRVLK